MNFKMPIDGGCACGRIRYTATTLPIFIFQCHCRDCQHATGAPFAVNVWFPNDRIEFNDEVNSFQVLSDSGNEIQHYFCEVCGSPLGMRRIGAPRRCVRASSLDDPSWIVPIANVWTSRAYPWEELNPKLKDFETQPNALEMEDIFKLQDSLFKSRGIVVRTANK